MSQRVLTFHYKLTAQTGEVLDSSEGREPLSFMEGAGQIIPGLERQMQSLKKGDKKEIKVVAAEAYGVREESLIVKVPREKLPTPNVKVGDRFRGGNDQFASIFTVVDLTLSEATLDGNHPLAGQDLTFDIEIMDIREATAQEIEHGHSHGAEGHNH